MHRRDTAANRQLLTRRKAVAEPALGRAEWHVSQAYLSSFSTHAGGRTMPAAASPGWHAPARPPTGAATWRHDRIGSVSRPSA
jgi:hypothetical protein